MDSGYQFGIILSKVIDILLWTYPHMLLEHPGKIIGILKSRTQGDLLNASYVVILLQQLFRVFDPDMIQILNGRTTDIFFEHFSKIAAAVSGFLHLSADVKIAVGYIF